MQQPCGGQQSELMSNLQDSVTTEPTSGPLANGSCGYGKRQLAQWPYLNVTAIAANNSLALLGLPKAGCGICIQITCSDQVRSNKLFG